MHLDQFVMSMLPCVHMLIISGKMLERWVLILRCKGHYI